MDKPLTQSQKDNLAVDQFAEAMKRKMAKARRKGKRGWDDPQSCTAEHLAALLMDEVTTDSGRPDPVDIANYAMMLHARGAEGREALRDACTIMNHALGD